MAVASHPFRLTRTKVGQKIVTIVTIVTNRMTTRILPTKDRHRDRHNITEDRHRIVTPPTRKIRITTRILPPAARAVTTVTIVTMFCTTLGKMPPHRAADVPGTLRVPWLWRNDRRRAALLPRLRPDGRVSG